MSDNEIQHDTPLDLSDEETAEDAARALHEYLKDVWDADDAKLYSPDDNPRQNGAWAVAWEGGPYEWAVNLTAGWSLAKGEFPQFTDPEVVGFRNDNWTAEPHFSFDLQFFDH